MIRTAGVACGCFYGPYLYLVVACGGLYIAGGRGKLKKQISKINLSFQLTFSFSGLFIGELRKEGSCVTLEARKFGSFCGKFAMWLEL